ncbi:MAG: hypothetical protein ACKVW3_10105 [Phycisphaerales bacterium]
MVYFGKVKNGKVELESDGLAEGTRVRVEPLRPDPADDLSVEAVETGLTDLSEEHDHYASGAPKRRKEP